MKFPIVIHKDLETDYSVTIPDLPGCFTAGATIEDAINMAHEAAECHIEGLLLDAEPVPTISHIENHRKNPDYADGIWAIIEINVHKLAIKSKRVNITIPENLLAIVDQYAKHHGQSRSGLVSQAVMEYMTTHH